MKQGNWIPMDKALLPELPKDRPFSKIEAMFSLTVAYDCKQDVSIRGFAKLWSWHRKTVERFLSNLDIKIEYETASNGKKTGKISVPPCVPDSVPLSVPFRMVDSKGLRDNGVPQDVPEGVPEGVPIIKPKPNPTTSEGKPSVSTDDETVDDCPQQEIIKLYHEMLPTFRKVKVWKAKREILLRTRWREDPKRQNLEWWRNYFLIVKHSPFLMGDNKNDWTPDLEWLVRPNNMPKVLEGKYSRKIEKTKEDEIDKELKEIREARA